MPHAPSGCSATPGWSASTTPRSTTSAWRPTRTWPSRRSRASPRPARAAPTRSSPRSTPTSGCAGGPTPCSARPRRSATTSCATRRTGSSCAAPTPTRTWPAPAFAPLEDVRADLLLAVGADPAASAPSAGDAGAATYAALRVGVPPPAARDRGGRHRRRRAFVDVSAALSDLADATLDAALAIARAEHPADVALCRLAVLALGKCGGHELNYISDVDVLFVAEPADGVDETEALQAATRLAQALMRACIAPTSEGTIWEVDPNLRPEGKNGALVRTLASYDGYYQRWASTWEFQALLKARPAAGDLELGRALRRPRHAAGVVGRRPAALRRGRAGDAAPGRGQRPGQGRRPPAQARARRAARRRVLRAAAAARARAQRRHAAQRHDDARARGARDVGLRRSRRRERAGRRRTRSCARSSTASSCTACGAPTSSRTPTRTCVASRARWATAPTRSSSSTEALQAAPP